MITPPEFDVYKNAKRDFSNVGVSLWLYIAMQICMSFVFGLIITAIYMVMIVDYTVLNAVSLFFVSFLSGLILVFYMTQKIYMSKHSILSKASHIKVRH